MLQVVQKVSDGFVAVMRVVENGVMKMVTVVVKAFEEFAGYMWVWRCGAVMHLYGALNHVDCALLAAQDYVEHTN